jgi:hypothetical protein
MKIRVTHQTDLPRPVVARKIFRFSANPNHLYNRRHPVPARGAYRDRHGRKVRDAMDAVAHKTNAAIRGRRSRVVLTPRRWRQVGGIFRWRRWQQSPVTGESTKETVKTIVQGMPAEPGEPVVTTRVLFTLHTRLRVHRTPGIPCALRYLRDMAPGIPSGASRRENADLYPHGCFAGLTRRPAPGNPWSSSSNRPDCLDFPRPKSPMVTAY